MNLFDPFWLKKQRELLKTIKRSKEKFIFAFVHTTSTFRCSKKPAACIAHCLQIRHRHRTQKVWPQCSCLLQGRRRERCFIVRSFTSFLWSRWAVRVVSLRTRKNFCLPKCIEKNYTKARRKQFNNK